MGNIYCIGELLIDFISPSHGFTLKDASIFEKKAGGAPANVCVAAANMNAPTYFLGQVGTDDFGLFLAQTLEGKKVNTKYLKFEGRTTLAFVSLASDGERSFDFFRGSDGQYVIQDSLIDQINSDDVVHFGSATALLPGKLRESYFKLYKEACEKGAFVSFDPNFRDLLISDLKQFSNDCLDFIKHADLVKLSDEEALMITDTKSIEEALTKLVLKDRAIVAVTLGAEGTLLYQNGVQTIVQSIKIKPQDTTGAGDCFIGTFIGQVATLGKAFVEDKDLLEKMTYTSNVAAAITCTRVGAISAMPKHEEILKEVGK